MTKNQKIAAAAVVSLTVVAAIQYKSLVTQVEARFPEIDKKIVRKAYRNMMMKSFAGGYATESMSSDQAMDAFFLTEVEKLTNK